MKLFSWLLLLCLALFTASSRAADPSYTPATMIKAINAELERIAVAVESVKDEASATKAAAQIQASADGIGKIAAKSQGMKLPDEAAAQALLLSLQKKSTEVGGRLEKAKPQVTAAGPKAMEEVSGALAAFGEAMNQAAKEFAKLDFPAGK